MTIPIHFKNAGVISYEYDVKTFKIFELGKKVPNSIAASIVFVLVMVQLCCLCGAGFPRAKYALLDVCFSAFLLLGTWSWYLSLVLFLSKK